MQNDLREDGALVDVETKRVEQFCQMHGRLSYSLIYEGTRFCPTCFRDALLNLGVCTVFDKVEQP
jgi:hypothetical protein